MDAELQRIVARMVERIDQTPVCDVPFPHFFVEDLLPPDVYAAVQTSLPAQEHYRPLRNYASRGHLPLNGERLSGGELAPLWRTVRDAFCSRELQLAVYGKLRGGLAFRFGIHPDAVDELAGYPGPTLFREGAGYAIAPHTDTRKKVVTMQLALPPDDSQRELGTALYRRSLAPSALADSPRGFVKVKQFPFLPNSAYAFVVLNTFGAKSWHGREPLQAADGVRHSLLNIYGRRPGAGFHAPARAAAAAR